MWKVMSPPLCLNSYLRPVSDDAEPAGPKSVRFPWPCCWATWDEASSRPFSPLELLYSGNSHCGQGATWPSSGERCPWGCLWPFLISPQWLIWCHLDCSTFRMPENLRGTLVEGGLLDWRFSTLAAHWSCLGDCRHGNAQAESQTNWNLFIFPCCC